MEKYIYYSIILFSIFILLLYVYLLYEKLLEQYSLKKSIVYKRQIFPFIDALFIELEHREAKKTEINTLRNMCKNKLKRTIVTNRIIYYNELFSGSIRDNITRLCEKIGLVDYEISNLETKDYFKASLACKNLGEFRSKKAVKHLLNKLNEKSLDLKYHALMGLAKIGDEDAFIAAFNRLGRGAALSERSLTEIIDSYEGDKEQLYTTMINSNKPYVSTLFLKSAGNYKNLKLNDIIFNYIYNVDKEKRIAAIKAIGQNGDIRYLNKIVDMLSDSEWEVRAAAAKSLGRLQDERSLGPLVRALSDSVWWVRYNAANSIIKIRKGISMLQGILSGEDKFAKDSILSALEDSGFMQEIFQDEGSLSEDKRNLADILRNYIINKSN
jgi:HEAT repeat protein